MITIITILVLYWFIATLIGFGILYTENEERYFSYHTFSLLVSILGAWFFVPLIIGRSLQKTKEVNDVIVYEEKPVDVRN